MYCKGLHAGFQSKPCMGSGIWLHDLEAGGGVFAEMPAPQSLRHLLKYAVKGCCLAGWGEPALEDLARSSVCK